MSDSADKPKESSNSLSDSDLVERARHGDGAAFELIIRHYNQTLFRAAKGVLDDEGQAQDVVQEAYLKAFTHLDSFQARSSLKTWLTRITVNQAIDFKRRRRPSISVGENVHFLHTHAEGAEMARDIIDHSTPETEATRQEMKSLLEAATRRLPDIYRSVFILRDVEGMSVADSAFCLDINEALVRKRLSRAHEMLREDLLERMESSIPAIFEFAGKRCDVVTANVMAELARRRMIVND